MSAEVTEADRERAMRACDPWLSSAEGSLADRVAAALAEERERARAPFLALAKQLDLGYVGTGSDYAQGANEAFRIVAKHIRRAAKDVQ